MVPRIDISALFSESAAGRDQTDAAIIKAAGEIGFMTICGLPTDVPIDAASRRAILRLFDLPQAELRKLWRQKFDPAHRNVYRGWFPLQNGFETYKEGIDLGPDIAFGASVVDPDDPLREATPLPPDSARFLAVRDTLTAPLRRAGYGYVETPVFEETSVFSRGVHLRRSEA